MAAHDAAQSPEDYLEHAVRLAVQNVADGGGPFGAVVVTPDGRLHDGVNRVTRDNDPTAHAEVVAIRRAASELGSFNLSGSVLYSSCEPCPLCLSAALWAGSAASTLPPIGTGQRPQASTMPCSTNISTATGPTCCPSNTLTFLHPRLPSMPGAGTRTGPNTEAHVRAGSRPTPSSSCCWSPHKAILIHPSPMEPNAVPGATATPASARKVRTQARTSPPLTCETSAQR
ncbi:guanine deaminase [Arthrobacter sp. Hiyo8]|nr:guanine deaminase [Arthrobacter sp. Hiyo8]